eukprot:m.296 g.296  ORF g.296 m.296 type:complete len:340 (-) comp97_c0_seq1:53-1072(-)
MTKTCTLLLVVLAATALVASAANVDVAIVFKDTQGAALDTSSIDISLRLFKRAGFLTGSVLKIGQVFTQQIAYTLKRAGTGDNVFTLSVPEGESSLVDYAITDVRDGSKISGKTFIKAPLASDRSRRSEYEFPVFVPTYLESTSHYKLVVVWKKMAGETRCDFDSVLTYPHHNTCAGCIVDHEYTACSDGGGYCYEYTWTWPWPSATHVDDDNCAGEQANDGKEIIDIVEPGSGTYGHLIYANKAIADLDGSYAQAHLYRKTTAGDIEFIASAFVEDAPTYNKDHRFFHTFQFTLDTPKDAYTITNREYVSCTPYDTTGSSDILEIEKKYNPDGLDRQC